MGRKFAVVDLFAGPGGLGEGFAAYVTPEGERPFSISLSVEKEPSAFATLLLRAFTRQFQGELPEVYYRFAAGEEDEPIWSAAFPAEWSAALNEVKLIELGKGEAQQQIDPVLVRLKEQFHGDTVLIGGPPCQAYSLVGRARNRGKAGYTAEKDERHFLYEEYIRILEKLRPAVFVMENVKGLLSSRVEGAKILDRVLDDLHNVGDSGDCYSLIPLTPRTGGALDLGDRSIPAGDFVVRCEDLDVPQARHRVIIVGVRADVARQVDTQEVCVGLTASSVRVPSEAVLAGLPKLRSGLSRQNDGAEAWFETVKAVMEFVSDLDLDGGCELLEPVCARARELLDKFTHADRPVLPRASTQRAGIGDACPDDLRDWIIDEGMIGTANHSTRSHIASDLARYFFAATFAQVHKTSPKATDFPAVLAPNHENWRSGKFADRFRVQLPDRPSSTITSHISKDGHYFIHPDPLQCRSLTVREAARLQTFPDNYLFKGNRTEQYVQVGNAVPPYLAHQIAAMVYRVLCTASEDAVPTHPSVRTEFASANG